MSHFLVILSTAKREPWAKELAAAAECSGSTILVSSIADAAAHLAREHITPTEVVFDIGARGQDVLNEIDALAHQCVPGTRVFAVGDANDIHLYRAMIQRGVIDYLPMPASIGDILKALRAEPKHASSAAPTTKLSTAEKKVIVFMSAASGDGASTAALNTAYSISQAFNGSTVLVDMDYQFGMLAKHLALQNKYGISDLFDYPDRGLDETLIKRMVANYGKLHVITAPSELRFLPTVGPEAIVELIAILKQSYDHIIIDLPHLWLPWIAACTQQASQLVLVSQLWLKSVSHASRMTRAFRELNIPLERIVPVINRHGAKFKEAIDPKDFERVCGLPIRFTLANDTKTIVESEGLARTVMEQPSSELAEDIEQLARHLSGLPPVESKTKRGSLFAWPKG